MSKLNTLLKENYDLKNELESMVLRVKENEVKHQGFKTVQYSMLLSDNLNEISDKPMRYIEEIFDIDKTALFIRRGAFAVAEQSQSVGSRVLTAADDAFKYTFLENNMKCGNDKTVIHKDFRLFPSDKEFSYILMPVMKNGGIAGALGFYSSDINRFKIGQNFDFVREFAVIAAIALKNLDNAFLLEMQAHTDYLTGLPNKFILDITGRVLFKNLIEDNAGFSFAMIDINNYKSINDTLGHIEGDEVLKVFARAMRRSIGDTDILGRFGGDEFYFFSREHNAGVLEAVLRNMADSMAAVDEPAVQNIPRGICCGFVTLNNPDEFESFEEAVRLADNRLREAKKICGKNGDYYMESSFCGSGL